MFFCSFPGPRSFAYLVVPVRVWDSAGSYRPWPRVSLSPLSLRLSLGFYRQSSPPDLFSKYPDARLIQGPTHLFPARYSVRSLQSIFMAGDVIPLLVTNGSALLGISFCSFCSMPGSLTNDRHEVLCESGTKALTIKQNHVVLRDPRNRMALITPPLLQLFLFSFTARKM